MYKWIQPDASNNKTGEYAPVILLIAPKKIQVITAGAAYLFSSNTSIKAELATSEYDINLFSKKDKGNDRGFAAKFFFQTNDRKITLLNKALLLQARAGYEFVQNRFKPIERLRNVEFLRDWSLPYEVAPADEHITHAALKNQITGL